MSINRILPTDTNLGDILSNVLPSTGNSGTTLSGGVMTGATTPGMGLGVGPIGSKPGDSNNIMNNGNGSTANGGSAGIIGSVGNSGSATNMGISNNTNGLDGLGGFLGGLDFSDALRNSCRSPPEQHQLSNNQGGNGSAPFGTQSFASAVSSYSGVAAAGVGVGNPTDNRPSSNNSVLSNNANNGTHVNAAPGLLNHHHHGGKFFDSKGALVGVAGSSGSGPPGPGCFDVGNLMNGPVGSSWKSSGNNGTSLGNQSLYDNLDNAFAIGFPMEPVDRDYSLFPSAGLSKCLDV